LFDGYVATASNEILKGTKDRITGSLYYKKIRAVREANIDVDIDPFGFLNDTLTSHVVFLSGRSITVTISQ